MNHESTSMPRFDAQEASVRRINGNYICLILDASPGPKTTTPEHWLQRRCYPAHSKPPTMLRGRFSIDPATQVTTPSEHRRTTPYKGFRKPPRTTICWSPFSPAPSPGQPEASPPRLQLTSKTRSSPASIFVEMAPGSCRLSCLSFVSQSLQRGIPSWMR